jgi:hypothetical protein
VNKILAILGGAVETSPKIRDIGSEDVSSPTYYVQDGVVAGQTGVRLIETFQGKLWAEEFQN